MSLETSINDLRVAIDTLTDRLASISPSPLVYTPTVKVAEVGPAPVQQPAAAMPPPPSFLAPAAAAGVSVPFSDTQGLTQYMMDAFNKLGPLKGPQLQNVLTTLGFANVSAVTQAAYPSIYQQIEALKAS